MIDSRYQSLAKKENRLPVSRLAAKYLKELNQAPSDHELWPLQLLNLAVDRNLLCPTDALRQKIDELNSWEPNLVSKFLELSEQSLGAKNPKELALQLLEELHLALSESLAGYPPLPPGSYR